MQTQRRESRSVRILLSEDGYLRMAAADAEQFFPEDTLVALLRNETLVLLPTRGAVAGGLILKRRNRQGDRSLLISEAFAFQIPAGEFAARWDASIGGLKVDLLGKPESNESVA